MIHIMSAAASHKDAPELGIGFYTVPEAARLLKIPPLNIRRWLGGYTYGKGNAAVAMPPLWQPQLPAYDHHIELGFRDLIELRVIKSFLDQGLSLITVRKCLEYARECGKDDHPFSTRRFQTDGRTIFLDSLDRSGKDELLDLKLRQYTIKAMIDRTFKDLDLSEDIVTRWRPFNGKKSIVIDPHRVFGQPIATDYGVPTVTLADAVMAEDSIDLVSYLYEVPGAVVRDAVNFEKSLLAA
jgi:uncharacterized protein (DUF433 family)/DNA-binding transcriptional MerR regulator